MEKESRSSILSAIDSRTKLIALITLIAEMLFLGSLSTLPSEQTLYALLACAFILIISIIGIVYIEVIVEGSNKNATAPGANLEREKSTTSSQDQPTIPNIPVGLFNELSRSYLEKKVDLSDAQKKILNFIERETKVHDSVNQKTLESDFSEHKAKVYVYWRLEDLRYQGFITRFDTGDRRHGMPVFSYKLSSEYNDERGKGK